MSKIFSINDAKSNSVFILYLVANLLIFYDMVDNLSDFISNFKDSQSIYLGV